jgi:hypothetical protein
MTQTRPQPHETAIPPFSRLDIAAAFSIPLLVAAIVLLLGAYRAAEHEPPRMAPGEGVLFAETFETGAAEWQLYPGRLSAEATGTALRLSIGQAGGGAFSLARPAFTDYDLRVTLRAVEGPVDNAFGVLVRAQPNDPAQLEDDGYLLFLISSDGYYRLARVVSSQVRIVSDWIPTSAIAVGIGAENVVRVVSAGEQVAFAINGVSAPLCLPNDPDAQSTYVMDTCIDGAMSSYWRETVLTDGRIGVAAQATETGGAGVVIDAEAVMVLGLTADARALLGE